MASELLVRRLFRQAGVSVLAGLLLSSAVLAEDNTDPAGGGDVSVSIGIDGGPDVSIDPVDPGDWGGEDGGDPGDASGDDGTGDAWSGDDSAEDGAADGSDAVEESGDDATMDPVEDDGMITLDPREWDGTFNDEGVPVAMEATSTGAPGLGLEPAANARDLGHSAAGAGAEAGFGWQRQRAVK